MLLMKESARHLELCNKTRTSFWEHTIWNFLEKTSNLKKKIEFECTQATNSIPKIVYVWQCIKYEFAFEQNQIRELSFVCVVFVTMFTMKIEVISWKKQTQLTNKSAINSNDSACCLRFACNWRRQKMWNAGYAVHSAQTQAKNQTFYYSCSTNV